MDWPQFFHDHDIEFVTLGNNVKRGNINIRCPWCGDDDPSQHLGVALGKEAYACWRNPQHAGKSPYRLIQALLGCSYSQARLVVATYTQVDPGGLDTALAVLTAMGEPPRPVAGHEVLSYPPEFRSIKATGSTARFWQYLSRRHFDDVGDLCARYRLQCALTERWKDRVIIPFFDQKALIGWTARAIQPTLEAPRYLSSSETVKKIIFNEDELMDGGKLLFVVEGPFDALKIDYYGEPYRVRATCGFGLTMTIDQISILSMLRKRFKKVVILFDQGATEAAFRALDWLQGPNVSIGSLPEGVKDPGELSRDGVEALMGEHL
jgi:hypothetical protein